MKTFTRRDFLRLSSVMTAGTVLAACAAPVATPAPGQQPTTAPTTGGETTPTAGGTLVFPWWFWEIVQEHTVSVHRVPRLVGGRLVNIDVDTTLYPNLAESWEVSDDATVFTFHLRPGVKWHDGEPFKATDIAFTVKYLMDETNLQATATATGWGGIKGAMAYKEGSATDIEGLQIVDDSTVVFTLEGPNAGWITSSVSQMNILPEHIYKDIAVGDLNEAHAPIWFEPRLHIGTGPFKWAEGEDEKFVRLERNDDYWASKPLLDGVLFNNVGDSDTRALALQKGEIDILQVASNYYLQALEMDNVDVFTFKRPYHRQLEINHTRPYLQDVRVRQAISHAIDRQLLADTIYAGLAEPWYSFMEMDAWLNQDAPTYPYDPAKAKDLLDAAAADGAWDPNQEIELAFYYPDNESRDFMAALQKFLTDAGFKARIAYYETAAMTDRVNQLDFDLVLSGWGTSGEPNGYANLFRCDDPAANIFHGAYPEVCNAMWALWEEGKTIGDVAQRKVVYDEIQTIFAEHVLAVPLFRFQIAVAVNKRVGGYGTGAQAYISSWEYSNTEAEKWFIRA